MRNDSSNDKIACWYNVEFVRDERRSPLEGPVVHDGQKRPRQRRFPRRGITLLMNS